MAIKSVGILSHARHQERRAEMNGQERAGAQGAHHRANVPGHLRDGDEAALFIVRAAFSNQERKETGEPPRAQVPDECPADQSPGIVDEDGRQY